MQITGACYYIWHRYYLSDNLSLDHKYCRNRKFNIIRTSNNTILCSVNEIGNQVMVSNKTIPLLWNLPLTTLYPQTVNISLAQLLSWLLFFVLWTGWCENLLLHMIQHTFFFINKQESEIFAHFCRRVR